MAAPKEILWRREPHTEGKHLVLREYLKAWLPILGKVSGRILFIDGFAGPGEYEGGEEGSPVIAMRTLAEHSAKIRAEVVFLFIEKDERRARHLKGLVDRRRPRLPPTAKVLVRKGDFDSQMTEALDQLDEQKGLMAPALVMIDPFGVKGMPMDVIRRILANPKCEVYASFMWESMNRFFSTPEFEGPLDELFGTGDWRSANDLAEKERRDFLYGLYRSQLKEAGAEQVVHFDLYAGNRLRYSIFFGTGHTKGSDRMKKAMWKVAPWGDFSFRGVMRDQLVLLEPQPDFQPLRDTLQNRFADQGWVTVADILEFVSSDETAYHDTQVKKPVLKPMEEEGLIRVERPEGSRKGTFSEGCRILFGTAVGSADRPETASTSQRTLFMV